MPEESQRIRYSYYKTILLTMVLYLVCFLAGALCIYLIQYRLQSSIRNNASRAAEQLKAGEDLEDGYQYMHINAYLYDGQHITWLQGHTSEEYGNWEAYIYHYQSFSKDEKQHYTIFADFFPLSFAAVASAPVSEGKTVYLFHSIRYLPSLFITYFLLYTFLFFVVFIYGRILKKTNEKVTEIYRCYVANVSHELKAPIASIRAITETLSAGLAEDEEAQSRCYGIIYREARTLEHSVGEIMELSRIQERRTDFSRKSVKAGEIFSPVREKYEQICEDLDICFQIDDSVFSLPVLYTNPERIRQLVEILLNNAVKFMDEDKEGKIHISAYQEKKHAVICVNDNGTGIEEKNLPHIFERFFKSNSSQNQSGTGLGLAIAKEITDALGETIRVESKPKEGSSFYFTIKLWR